MTILYRLEMGTAKAKIYNSHPKDERKQFIIDNYDDKVIRPRKPCYLRPKEETLVARPHDMP